MSVDPAGAPENAAPTKYLVTGVEAARPRSGVLGVKVYDARLVATMNVYAVDSVVTFNVVKVIQPPALVL
jgi:hypothetical protein